MVEMACRSCRRLIKGNLCLVCKTNDVTRNWSGTLIIKDINSEIAKKAGISAPGRYAVRVK